MTASPDGPMIRPVSTFSQSNWKNLKHLDSRVRSSMANTDKRKQSLYFPEEMLKEIQDEANRQDRSLSWIVQQAWRIARTEIMRFPSVNDVLEAGRDE